MRALLLVMLLGSSAVAAPCAKRVRDAVEVLWGQTGQAPSCRAIGGMTFVQSSTSQTPDEPVNAALVFENNLVWQQMSIPGTPGDTYTYAFADLDGDGRDELLVHDHHDGHMGSSSERLTVLRIGRGEVAEGPTLVLAIGMDARDGNSCTSSGLAIVGGRTRRVQMETAYTRRAGFPPPEGCPPEGLHRFRLRGDAFVIAD